MSQSQRQEKVVSLRAFRTLKECQRLFSGYESKLESLDKADLLNELDRYKVEASRYPRHLLTIVKGEILMQVVKRKSFANELKEFADFEAKRIRLEVARRLHE